jgi:hypothetical protein
MSLLAQYECPDCGGYLGWAGERARRDPLRAYLACTCVSADEQLTETHGDPLLNMAVEQVSGSRREAA